MADAKHTPGPWTLELVQEWPFGIKVHAGGEVILSQSAVCNSTKQETRRDCEQAVGFNENDQDAYFRADFARKCIAEQDANARLIAAAPELLAVLMEALEDERGILGELGYYLGSELKRRAEAAIAKANGEQA